MKRILSVVLCICILMTTAITAFAGTEGKSPYCTTIPTIYLEGANSPLAIYHEDGSRDIIYPLEFPKEKVMEIAKKLLPVFAKAFITQKWDKFCVVLTEVMADVYKDIRLDETGHPTNGSSVKTPWQPSWISKHRVDKKYPIDQYKLHYDWRLDPYESADVVHDYIEAVLSITYEKKVNLISRCLGASIAAAYMDKYHGEYVNEWILYNSAIGSETQCSKAFAGEIYLTGDGIGRFAYDINKFDDPIQSVVESVATMAQKTYGLDIAAWAVNNVYKDIYLNVVPPIVSQTYATLPAYWSMVSPSDYEKAKEVAFYGQDMDKWAGFIDTIDHFHNRITARMPEFLQEVEDMGVEVNVIGKYGFQNVPVTRDDEIITDGMCELAPSTVGATTATILSTFDADYLAKAEQNGTAKYISPDKQVDASTCYTPDKTWFIKNQSHYTFPECVEELMWKIFETEDFTVFDDPQFPQYLFFNKETKTISPLSEENMNSAARYNVSFFKAFFRFWKALFQLIFKSKK